MIQRSQQQKYYKNYFCWEDETVYIIFESCNPGENSTEVKSIAQMYVLTSLFYLFLEVRRPADQRTVSIMQEYDYEWIWLLLIRG